MISVFCYVISHDSRATDLDFNETELSIMVQYSLAKSLYIWAHFGVAPANTPNTLPTSLLQMLLLSFKMIVQQFSPKFFHLGGQLLKTQDVIKRYEAFYLAGKLFKLGNGTIQKLEKFPETDHIHQASPSIYEQEGLLRDGVQPGELPRRDRGQLSCLGEEAQTNYTAQKSQSPTCGVPVSSRFLYFISHYAFWGRLC